MQTPLARKFHKHLAERRSATGFTAAQPPKPVTDRRSTLSAIHAVCEICGLGPLACRYHNRHRTTRWVRGPRDRKSYPQRGQWRGVSMHGERPCPAY